MALLIAVLAAGVSGPTLASAAEHTQAGALNVDSQPAGAAVYVDGQFKGETPLTVTALENGSRRVLVKKGGFLENSRVVAVEPGSKSSLRVNLTPDARDRHVLRQVEPEPAPVAPPPDQPIYEESGGGSSLKWVLIGGGVLAAGAAVYLLLPKNDPPVVSGVTSDPGSGTAGIVSVTNYRFSANASDPNNDPLTYEWNFGDGSTSTAASAQHVYSQVGTFTVTLTVSDDSGESATGTTQVTVVSLAGSWDGTWYSGYTFTIDLRQSGTSLSGDFRNQWGGTSPMSGTVTAPRSVSWTFSYYCDSWTGTVSEDGNTINGDMHGCASGTYTMRRR